MPLFLENLCSSLRLARWALAPSLALAIANPAQADEVSPASADDGSREQAKAAASQGQTAFLAEDYAAALVAFDEANRLRPTPKLDYNLGICHLRLQALALSEGDHDAERLHASAAIEALNRYLAARPTADDRPAVEEMVRELGGTPVTAAVLKPVPKPVLRGPTADPPAPAPEESADDGRQPDQATSQDTAPSDMSYGEDTESSPEPAKSSVELPRSSLSAALGLWWTPQMNAHPTVEAALMGALMIGGGVHLGARRRLFVGAGVAVASAGKAHTATKLGSAAQTFDALVGYHLPIGRAGRLFIPLTGILGAGRQALRKREDTPRLTCSIDGARWGGRVGARAGILYLLGQQHDHGLNIAVDTVANLYGHGPVTDGCSQSSFQGLAVPRAQAWLGLHLGYELRF